MALIVDELANYLRGIGTHLLVMLPPSPWAKVELVTGW